MTADLLCRHFGRCGGCAHQDMPDDAYRALKRSMVVDALARHGLFDGDVAETVGVGAATRRRATFKAEKTGGAIALGFHATATHDVVDMLECRVLTPGLFALTAGLRQMLAALLRDGEKVDVAVCETLNGADVTLALKRRPDAAMTAEAARWATRLKLARLSCNDDVLAELASPDVAIGTARVRLPRNGFLQPSAEGERILQDAVLAGLRGTRSVVDLFAGCGTFALALAPAMRVHAVEQDGGSLEALSVAARATGGLKPVTVERRDLFKRPLGESELARFDGAVLDPPRAGALAQARILAASKIRRLVYVSCNPETFARDARVLADGGYRMGTVVPVDQFLWSSHIELATAFTRG